MRHKYLHDSYELYKHLKNTKSNSFDSCQDLILIKENDKKYFFTHQLLHLAENQFKLFIQSRFIKRAYHKRKIEWKTIIKKIDIFSRIISFISLLIAPLFVFGKYIVRDFLGVEDQSIYKCGCEVSI